MSRANLTVTAVLLLSPALLLAQKKGKNDQQNADPTARATVLHVANLYVQADSANPPIANAYSAKTSKKVSRKACTAKTSTSRRT